MAHANCMAFRRLIARLVRSPFARAAVLATAWFAVAPQADAQEGAQPSSTAPASTAPVEIPYDGPTMSVQKLTDVFQLSIENGYLSLDTNLSPTTRPTRVIVPGLPQHGEVAVDADDAVFAQAAGAPAPAGEEALRRLRFTTPPDGNVDATIKTTVAALPNGLHIDQFSESDGILRSVQFIQNLPVIDPADPADAALADSQPRVRMHVQVSGSDDGVRQPVRLLFTADSFTELRQRHPLEVSTYFAPLLILLQQDGVLAPELAVARRALVTGPATAPAAELTARVNDLVKQLASPEQATRGDAFRALQQLGEPALAAIATLDRATLSAEQNSLLDLLLTGADGATPADATALATDPLFLLDCLSLPDPTLRAAAFDRLKQVTRLADLSYDATTDDLTRRRQSLAVREKVNTWATTHRPAAP
jgi:hypothetical protein